MDGVTTPQHEHEWEQVWFERVADEIKLVGPFRCRICRAVKPEQVAPAPAEERETPVEEEYTVEQTAEQWAGFRKWLDARPNVAAEVRALLLRESAALPAEDRAVTAPQEPEKSKVSGEWLDYEGLKMLVCGLVCELNRAVVPDTLQNMVRQAISDRAGERERAKRAESKLAALTHAIEALRGELETLKAIGVIREKD